MCYYQANRVFCCVGHLQSTAFTDHKSQCCTKSSGEGHRRVGADAFRGTDSSVRSLGAKRFISRRALKTAILVGGGAGIASLMLLAAELKRAGVRTLGVVGATNRARLLSVSDLREIDVETPHRHRRRECRGIAALSRTSLMTCWSDPKRTRCEIRLSTPAAPHMTCCARSRS